MVVLFRYLTVQHENLELIFSCSLSMDVPNLFFLSKFIWWSLHSGVLNNFENYSVLLALRPQFKNMPRYVIVTFNAFTDHLLAHDSDSLLSSCVLCDQCELFNFSMINVTVVILMKQLFLNSQRQKKSVQPPLCIKLLLNCKNCSCNDVKKSCFQILLCSSFRNFQSLPTYLP